MDANGNGPGVSLPGPATMAPVGRHMIPLNGHVITPQVKPRRDGLAAWSTVALWVIAALIAAASAASFAQSYRGLWLWAQRHGLPGFWAAAFPAQVDLFIAVGELTLFVALARRWDRRSRIAAWVVASAGLAVSVAGNVGHAPSHDLASRVTWAVPPVAAFAALYVGLGVLKRIAGHAPGHAGTEADKVSTARTDMDKAMSALRAGQHDGKTNTALAAELGVGPKTVQRAKTKIKREGNGNG